MAATAMIHARIDPKVKRQSEIALHKMGLSISDAVRLMLTRVSTDKTLPFEVGGYAATLKAVEEVKAGKTKRVASVAALFAEAKK